MNKIKTSLVGKRFGKLTVIEYSGIDKHHHSQWLCRCECGNEIIATRDHLITGNTTSCGCKKHIPKYKDITGKRFGRLTVIRFDHINNRNQSCWLCQCDCGNQVIVQASSMNSGNTSSCGCYKNELAHDNNATHGLSKTRLYKVWQGMKTRCENENFDSYYRYGERGISVCDEWKQFENFKDWADISGYEDGLSLDRIDNNGNYCANNCRWTTQQIQCNNRSSNHIVKYHDIEHTVADWARLLNVPYTTLQARLRRGDMRDFMKYFNEENCL